VGDHPLSSVLDFVVAIEKLNSADEVWNSFVRFAARFELPFAALVDLPGPGFFPLCLGAIIVVLSAIIGIGHWRSADGEAVELGHRDVVVVTMTLLVVPLVFESLGAYITLGLFGTALLVLIARVRPLVAAAATGAGLAACWDFFQVLLGLQLPTEPL